MRFTSAVVTTALALAVIGALAGCKERVPVTPGPSPTYVPRDPPADPCEGRNPARPHEHCP